MKKRIISVRNLVLLWTLGMAGQLCWNIENQWFNTFVYKNISQDPDIISWMVAISAIATAFSTFFFGTLSDRKGVRRPFVGIGYILWGIFTIAFGLTMYLSKITSSLFLIATLVVFADAIMSFFGSMGNDSGFNAWTTDMLNDQNRGAIGATLAAQPVLGTIVGTVLGGLIIDLFGYMAFFLFMGIIVIVIGIVALLTMKEDPSLSSSVQGSFWKQFLKGFNFKKYFTMKELVWVNLTTAVFFIAFNVYFVHIGNLFLFRLGFTEGDSGIIQGVGLIVAILFTIPAIKLINKGKSALLLCIAFAIDIIGMLTLYLSVRSVNTASLFNLGNIWLFIGIILAGIGYVIMVQVGTVWAKKLYPKDARGQFEGIRIIFFVLIPMIIGPLIANPLIKKFGTIDKVASGVSVEATAQIPTEELFLAAGILVLLTYIPLYFANKYAKKRIALEHETKEASE